jgi:hypothetical protein
MVKVLSSRSVPVARLPPFTLLFPIILYGRRLSSRRSHPSRKRRSLGDDPRGREYKLFALYIFRYCSLVWDGFLKLLRAAHSRPSIVFVRNPAAPTARVLPLDRSSRLQMGSCSGQQSTEEQFIVSVEPSVAERYTRLPLTAQSQPSIAFVPTGLGAQTVRTTPPP